MARRKNKKRIDPRYFLHETTYRDEEEVEANLTSESAYQVGAGEDTSDEATAPSWRDKIATVGMPTNKPIGELLMYVLFWGVKLGVIDRQTGKEIWRPMWDGSLEEERAAAYLDKLYGPVDLAYLGKHRPAALEAGNRGVTADQLRPGFDANWLRRELR